MSYEEKRKADAKEMAEKMAKFANNVTFNRDIPYFVEAMGREHRTLQQSFSGLCFAWIQHLASLEENQYDARNEASVKTAKKIMEHIDKYDIMLPFI